MQITARAPLRIGLAGGGTDVDPFATNYGGFILNATINRYAYTFIKPTEAGFIEFEAKDRNAHWKGRLANFDQVPEDLMLHKAAFLRMLSMSNSTGFPSIKMTTYADSPAGSGLGTSSTIVVSMVQGLSDLMNVPMGEYDIARIAWEIERLDCGLSGGAQDQYAAAFGGINFMEFHANNRVVVNPLRIRETTLNDLEVSLVLYFTGVSRQSAKIIDAQKANVVGGKPDAIKALLELKQQAHLMKEALLFGKIDLLAEALRAGWESKKRTAVEISNSMIDEVYERAINKGALAGKISGAGGGGFMMFVVEPEQRLAVINELTSCGGQVFPCGFSKRGATSWRSPNKG
jgi:D-glycero-alpha-D-manno-heptose-7-phosphate kinase